MNAGDWSILAKDRDLWIAVNGMAICRLNDALNAMGGIRETADVENVARAAAVFAENADRLVSFIDEIRAGLSPFDERIDGPHAMYLASRHALFNPQDVSNDEAIRAVNAARVEAERDLAREHLKSYVTFVDENGLRDAYEQFRDTSTSQASPDHDPTAA